MISLNRGLRHQTSDLNELLSCNEGGSRFDLIPSTISPGMKLESLITTLEDLVEKKGGLFNPGAILVQITNLLKTEHELGRVHGKLNPACISIKLNGTAYTVISLNYNSAISSDWNFIPTKKSPTFKDDIFVLGCLFYYVFTNGKHPFGRSEHRREFVKFNLYHLGELNVICKEAVWLETIIRKMIHYDPNRRPLIIQLELRHPIFWSDQDIAEYLTLKANSITSQESRKWDDIVLFPSSSSEQLDDEEDISDILTVTDALKQIKTSKNVLQWHKTYPDLLSAINDGFQTTTAFAEALQSSNFPSTEKNNLHYYEMEPNSSNNLLIAGEFFGNMDIDGNEDIEGNMMISKKIKRYHGRLGGRYVHVFLISDSDESIKRIKTLRYINHLHILQILFLDPVSAWVAVEPFQNTLNKWIDQRISNEIETDKVIMMQITKAVTYLHSKDIIHGTLSTKQIVFIQSQDKCLTKIAYFPLDDEKIRPEHNNGSTKKDDIIQLGIIFQNILQNEIDLSGEHLLKCMRSDSQDVPPSEAITYHQFFWNKEKMIKFQGMSSHHLKKQNGINDLLKKFNILQQWLFLEKNKNDYDDIYVYYHSNYDFSRICLAENVLQETSDECLKENYSLVILPTEKATGTLKIEKKLPDLVTSTTKIPFSLPLRYFLDKAEKENHPPQVGLKRCLETYVGCLQKAKSQKLQLPINQPIDVTDVCGRTALHLASFSDEFIEPATKLMRDFGFNPNIHDKLGYAPLHYAVFTQSLRIITLLLEHYALVNIFGGGQDPRTPLLVAMSMAMTTSNYIDIAQRLLSGKDAKEYMDLRLRRNALHVAADIKSVDLVKHILEQSLFENIDAMDVDGHTALHIAVSRNSLECTRLLLEYGADLNAQNKQQASALHIATRQGLKDMMKLLLNWDANPNLTDLNQSVPLHLAVMLKNPDLSYQLVDLLLQYLQNKQTTVNMKDIHGVTALHIAAFLNRTEVVMLLIQNEANVKTKANNSGTPLDFATSNDAYLVAVLLLAEGAKVNRKGWKLRTPLHIAASCGAQQTAQILIDSGSDKNARDELGLTPMHYACLQQPYDNNKYNQKFIELLQPDTEPMSKPITPADIALVPYLLGPLFNLFEAFPPNQPFNLKITQHITVNQKPISSTSEVACQTDDEKVFPKDFGDNEKISSLMERIRSGQNLGQTHWYDLLI